MPPQPITTLSEKKVPRIHRIEAGADPKQFYPESIPEIYCWGLVSHQARSWCSISYIRTIYHNQLPELYLIGDYLSILFPPFFRSFDPLGLLPVDASLLPGVDGGDRRRKISD